MYGIKEAARQARRHHLSRFEELSLHAAYLAGDDSAGRRLVVSFLPVIMKSAYARGMPAGHAQDMMGVAIEGFMTNLHRYDPTRGVRLWAYMRFWVRSAVIDYALANRSLFRLATPHDKTAISRLDFEKSRMGASGRPLSGREARQLAAVFGVTESIIHGIDDDMSVLKPESLRSDNSFGHNAVEDPERVGGHLDFEARHDHARLMELLEAGMERLDPRQREIIRRRFKETPDTLHDISADMGISGERIRQIEGVALRHLRHAMENPQGRRMSAAAVVRRYSTKDAASTSTQYIPSTKRSYVRRTDEPRRRGKDAGVVRRPRKVVVQRSAAAS